MAVRRPILGRHGESCVQDMTMLISGLDLHWEWLFEWCFTCQQYLGDAQIFTAPDRSAGEGS